MSGFGSVIPGLPFIPFPSSSVQVAAGGITAAAIAAGAITSAKFAANAIDANAIADGAIDAGAIAAAAITAAKFGAGAIDANAFAQAAADKVWATAARAITDKAGFTLTAGSYSIRPSSTQRGTQSVASGTGALTISSVTTTRAQEDYAGDTANTSASTDRQWACYCQLTAATTVTFTRFSASASTNTAGVSIIEVF